MSRMAIKHNLISPPWLEKFLGYQVSRTAKTQSNQSTMVGEILRFQVCRMAKIESNQSIR